MSAEDYFNFSDAFDQMDNGYDDDYCIRPIRGLAPKTCRHCGETGLYWLRVGDSWKLGKHGAKHICLLSLPYGLKPRKGSLFP